MFAVYKITWTEYERGWGQRPDGYSYHVSKEFAEKYVKDYWKDMPKETPDEYSKPSEPVLAEVSEELFNQVQNEKNVRTWR
jgi:hypothetical protein